MKLQNSSKYVDEQVLDRLNGVSAHLINLGFQKDQLDPRDIDPEYDVQIDEALSEYKFQEGADPYPAVDVLQESVFSEVRLDTERGYFEFETNSGETAEGWMPYLDEGKAEGIFLIQNPWSEEVNLGAYDGIETAIPDQFSGIEPMLKSAYRTAREYISNKGQRNTSNPMRDLQSNLKGFEKEIRDLESEKGRGEVDGSQHSGKLRGRDIVKGLSGSMKRARKANIVDYPVATGFGDHSFERTAGGYKSLTNHPDSAPYNSMEEAIEFRYPDSWLEKEQN